MSRGFFLHAVLLHDVLVDSQPGMLLRNMLLSINIPVGTTKHSLVLAPPSPDSDPFPHTYWTHGRGKWDYPH